MIVDLAINSLGNAAGITRGIAKNLGIGIKYAERFRIGLLISLFNEIIESAYPFQPSRLSGELQFFAELFLPGVRDRSEEHTSELQSLMRISYAVFCLKKKTK